MSTVEELISKSQTGDMEAKERLVIENSGLIWSIARRYNTTVNAIAEENGLEGDTTENLKVVFIPAV